MDKKKLTLKKAFTDPVDRIVTECSNAGYEIGREDAQSLINLILTSGINLKEKGFFKAVDIALYFFELEEK